MKELIDAVKGLTVVISIDTLAICIALWGISAALRNK